MHILRKLLEMRIMITAGGTVTAQSLIKALRADSRDHFIVIGDMDPVNATKAFAEAFEPLPRADDIGFAETCLDAVKRHSIELLVPLIVEREFLPLIARRGQFRDAGCILWAPDENVVRTIGDKLLFAHYLERIGISTPRTVEYSPEMSISEFPVFLKPRHGSGSAGTTKISSATTLHETAAGRSDLIVQHALEGPEFTVDCFAAAPGRVVAAVPRERMLIKAGVSVKGRTYHDQQIENISAEVVATSGIVGPANVQGMVTRQGSFCVIEMNPRFSGTLALTTAAGINFGSLLIDCVEGKHIGDLRGTHQAGVTMMRYWQEVFEFEDGGLTEGQTMSKIRIPAGGSA